MPLGWEIPAICALLTLVTAAVYFSLASYPFINLDDTIYVSENPHVQAGVSWQTITWAMTTGDTGNWHPLTWLSHALDCQLYGLDAGAHHVTSLVIHVVNVLLLFLLLARATGMTGRSALVAALFALHPLNVESVAWIAERKNVLSMLFFLLALGAYGWYVQRPTWKRYCLVALLFAMGLASKPMIITLPCNLFLLDYWPLGRIRGWTTPSSVLPVTQLQWPRLAVEKLPLLLLSAGSAVVTVIVQRAGTFIGPLGILPLHIRAENAVYSYALYLAKIFWPSELALYYPHPLDTLTIWQITLALVLLAAVTVFGWKQHARHGYLLSGWLWFLGTLVPVIGIIQVGGQGMADRYAYLPGIGVFLMLVWGGADFIEAKSLNSRAAVAVAIAALAGLLFVTLRQVGYWESSDRLWTHTLEDTHNNFIADDIYGHLLLKEGRPEAVDYIEHVTELAPTVPYRAHAHAVLSFAYSRMEDYAHAREQLRIALSLDPYEVHKMLRELSATIAQSGDPLLFWRLGLLYEEADQFPEARAAYQKALELNPQFSPARTALEALNTNQH